MQSYRNINLVLTCILIQSKLSTRFMLYSSVQLFLGIYHTQVTKTFLIVTYRFPGKDKPSPTILDFREETFQYYQDTQY